MTDELKLWLTVKQAAARAQVSEATIRREAKARRLLATRVGGRRSWRFRVKWIDDWLENGATEWRHTIFLK